jgi:hypothetical protein
VRDGLGASGATDSHAWPAIWGYLELVGDPRHSDELIERKVAALRIFWHRWEAAAGLSQ